MVDTIKKLSDLFAEFPTIGSRTAKRLVFYLIKLPKEKIDELTNAIQELKSEIKLCSFCFNPHELKNNLCAICQNPSRNKQLLCIVEKETDLTTIENTGKYKGLYFVAGTIIGPRGQTNTDGIEQLSERIKNPKKFGLPPVIFQEVILGLNPTPGGKAAAVLIARTLKELSLPNLKITHLAQGLPVGGELEYADQETLESAFEGRR